MQNLKKRYFQLRLVEAATIRGLILEPRYRPLNTDTHLDDSHNQTKKVYILESFKEMPQTTASAATKQITPKHRIVFDYNIKELTKSQQTTHAFELSETSIETSKETRHLFVADSNKTFDDWFTSIEKIIALNQKISRTNKTEMMLINEKLLSPISSLNSASVSLASGSSACSSSASATTSSSSTSSVSDASISPNQSTSSERNSNQSSTRNSHFLDDFKLANNNNLNQQQFIENFHLEKVNTILNEEYLYSKINLRKRLSFFF